jgi:hypothetical protein
MHYLGINSLKATLTCHRDRLPEGVPNSYFHYDKIAVLPESKVARFQQPIVEAMYVAPTTSGENSYVRAHCSFQSTGGANISTVNSMREIQLYVKEKSCGRGEQKRKCGIEMNELRDVYTGAYSYSSVDSVDHLLKNGSATTRLGSGGTLQCATD